MVDGGACTHPVGPCPSDSAGAQLGSLNAADPPMPEPHEDLVELDLVDMDERFEADLDHELGVLVAAGGESGRSSAMVDGGACTHPVGACPSDSAGGLVAVAEGTGDCPWV